MLDKFIKYLKSQLGSAYVWGAQGESVKSVIQNYVKSKETSITNVNRVMAFINKKLPDDLYFYDCSGLGVNWLLKNKLIAGDMTANGLYKKCEPVSKSQLKRGDWVFIRSNGSWVHIGYVVDNNLNVIESKGRDDGVVKRPLAAGSWNGFGRPVFAFPELKSPTKYQFKRVLRRTNPYMRGEDVEFLQELIGAEADGIFGADTEEKVKSKQKTLGLTADGIVGKNTVIALGHDWVG